MFNITKIISPIFGIVNISLFADILNHKHERYLKKKNVANS